MSAAKHTPGLVMVNGPVIQTVPTDTHPVGFHLALTLNPYAGAVGAGAMVEGNTARIVAAWNACDGISTEALEGGVVRDLLEALQLAYRHLNGGSDSLTPMEHAQAFKLARAAILKATGGASHG